MSKLKNIIGIKENKSMRNYNHLEVRKEAGSFFVKVNVLRIDYLKAFFTGKLEIKLDASAAAGVSNKLYTKKKYTKPFKKVEPLNS
jgi:hypothetical protein